MEVQDERELLFARSKKTMAAVATPWHLRPRLEQFFGYQSPALEAPDYQAYELGESFALNRLLGNIANMELAEQDIEHMSWRDGALRRAAAPYDLPVSVLKHAHELRFRAGDVEDRGYKPPSEAASEADFLTREWSESIMADPSIVPTPFSFVDEQRWKLMFPLKFGAQVTPAEYRGLNAHWKYKVRADHKHMILKEAREEAARAQEAAARAAKELTEAEKRAAGGGLMSNVKTGLGAMSSGLASGSVSAVKGGANIAGGVLRGGVNLAGIVGGAVSSAFRSREAPPTETTDLRPASFSRPSAPGTGLLGGPQGFDPRDLAQATFKSSLGMNNVPDILREPFAQRAYLMSYVLENLQIGGASRRCTIGNLSNFVEGSC